MPVCLRVSSGLCFFNNARFPGRSQRKEPVARIQSNIDVRWTLGWSISVYNWRVNSFIKRDWLFPRMSIVMLMVMVRAFIRKCRRTSQNSEGISYLDDSLWRSDGKLWSTFKYNIYYVSNIFKARRRSLRCIKGKGDWRAQLPFFSENGGRFACAWAHPVSSDGQYHTCKRVSVC